MPQGPTSTVVSVSVVSGQPRVSPDPVPVRGKDRTITFKLLTPGYGFPTSGSIVVVGGHKAQFPQEPQWVDAQTVTLLDCNSNASPKSYTYRITVIDEQGRPLVLDPTIENEGRPAKAEA